MLGHFAVQIGPRRPDHHGDPGQHRGDQSDEYPHQGDARGVGGRRPDGVAVLDDEHADGFGHGNHRRAVRSVVDLTEYALIVSSVHAVLPTALTLEEFYRELVETQRVLSVKHLGFSALREAAGLAVGRLLHGQTNFVKMLWKFNSVYNANRQYADHFRDARYLMNPPSFHTSGRPGAEALYIHNPRAGATGAASAPAQLERLAAVTAK